MATRKAIVPTDEKFDKQDLDLFEVLAALDKKDYDFFDRLSPEQQKKFVPFTMIHFTLRLVNYLTGLKENIGGVKNIRIH